MSLLRKKSWWQSILGSRITLLALSVAVIGLVLAVYDRYMVEREVSERRREAEAELYQLTERKAALQDRMDYLNNEQGMEAEIRRHFDVAKEGERVVILLGGKTDRSAATTTEKAPERPRHWWNIFSW